MGIPGLINAIGPGERISLSKLAITHLEQTARPIRIAVDISIWLFQVQAGRGGRNPEIRTLFYRLLKFLALPIHPLFVYDGKNKPPFKRGKAVSGQGNAPIIQISKRLIDLFRFPRHDAPGEAEAECANLQRAGIVDAVMSNDVDAMMFGSKMTIMNFSKESGSTTSASHVTCYRMDSQADTSNVNLDRPGMVLFAMLSGGDYLPSGVPKCGSKLAAEISKAGFGSDLLDAINAKETERMEQLSEWRERLQYELETNESGYFNTKHKAVRIPQSFPDQTILEYYASPAESNAEELAFLQRRLMNAWDQDIEPLEIRHFAARFFDWNYRSGARKVIRLLAEPLVSYRIRLRRQLNGSTLSNSDIPMLRKVYKSRASYSTDGLTELQVDVIPINVVGLDLFAEEPNPPLPSQASEEAAASGDEVDDDPEAPAESAPQSPVKKRVTKRYDPYAPEKMWVFEALARIGIPDVVEQWEKEQAARLAPKKPTNRKTGPKKKGPLDPGMKHGSILKYGTVTKPRPGVSQFKQAQLFEAAIPSTPNSSQSPKMESQSHTRTASPKFYMPGPGTSWADSLDNLVDIFSPSYTIPPELSAKRRSRGRPRLESRRAAICSDGIEVVDLEASGDEFTLNKPSPPPIRPQRLKISVDYPVLPEVEEKPKSKTKTKTPTTSPSPSPTKKSSRRAQKVIQDVPEDRKTVEKLGEFCSKPSSKHNPVSDGQAETHDCVESAPPKRRSPRKKTPPTPSTNKPTPEHKTDNKPSSVVQYLLQELPDKKKEKKHQAPKQRAKKNKEPSPSGSLEAKDSKEQTKPIEDRSSAIKGTSQHVDAVIVHDGSWTVEPASESENNNDSAKDGDDLGSQGRETKAKKKRISRVSILDLT
ncbi:hypothetical protein SI65_09676 [Aspergillus cristatus]|uniref:XPG-I domain-containing protein n=1 Tax=Aspergillus cristatus TaxID=573508 RepID=A0A1E3B1Y6_ASPCR|nr:hypothetical protein SI65_09676 [Aspergillus cristatus]